MQGASSLFRLLGDEPGVFEQPEVPGDARLRHAENAGQLADVEAVLRQDAEEPQAGGVGQEPKQGGGALHRIYESTYVDTRWSTAPHEFRAHRAIRERLGLPRDASGMHVVHEISISVQEMTG